VRRSDPRGTLTGDTHDTDSEAEVAVRAIVLALRDIVVGAICSGALVAFVLNYPIIGVVLGVIGLWQVARIMRGRKSIIGIDQRWADQEGKPNVRG
jgi:uncharacterized membrane protein YoaK (UPF0700 family)